MDRETFEQVEKHLFKRCFRMKDGQWTVGYYGVFRDWRGKNRRIRLSADLKTATASGGQHWQSVECTKRRVALRLRRRRGRGARHRLRRPRQRYIHCDRPVRGREPRDRWLL